MESFFKSLKAERVDHVRYGSRQQARTDIVHWIEGFYNRRRLRKGPRQADKSNVEISGLKTLGMNDIGGTLPSDSCGLYSL
jgi:hypothetical protein